MLTILLNISKSVIILFNRNLLIVVLTCFRCGKKDYQVNKTFLTIFTFEGRHYLVPTTELIYYYLLVITH